VQLNIKQYEVQRKGETDMKKLFIASLVVGLLVAFAVPALAQSTIPPGQDPEVCDVSFDVDVLKVKNIAINKAVNKSFNFALNLTLQIAGFPQWAEVEAFKCDHNEGNEVSVSDIVTANNIVGSFNGFIGIAQVNQASGILNNQGNILAAGLTGKTGDQQTFGITMVEAAVEKANVSNEVSVDSIVTTDTIATSFDGFIGLAQINQASGILNNQNNVVVLGTNLDTTGLVAENDTFLSMRNTTNEAEISNIQTTATIRSSFNQYQGAAQVNQAPGILNNQTNIISIAYAGRQ
jgi:hypothetical protein